jgi:rhodanese-related sulfurtransferase
MVNKKSPLRPVLSRLWWLPLGKVPEVEPAGLKRWLDEGRPLQLIDSRTGLEFQSGTIVEARHAPVTGLPGSIDRLDLDPEKPVVVLCLSGHRSLPGTRLLRARGIEAYSLRGGMIAWKLAGFPLVSPNANM